MQSLLESFPPQPPSLPPLLSLTNCLIDFLPALQWQLHQYKELVGQLCEVVQVQGKIIQ